MTTNQTIFPVTANIAGPQRLQLQQGLLWEFYKTWVSNQTELDSIAQGTEMFGLYQHLSLLLDNSTGSNLTAAISTAANTKYANTPYTLNEKPLLKFAEKDFSAVINFIIDVIAPEKIFCVNHQIGADGVDHADLMLIISDKSAKTFDELEKMVDFACLKHHHLSCTLIKASFFSEMIRSGHIYFSMACNGESLIYDNGLHELPKLRLDKRETKIERTNLEFYSGMAKAKAFYATAQNCKSSNVRMAAFMLHQAAELCLRAFNRSLTTQDKTTHSLKALLRFSLRCTTKLAMLMNNGDAEAERLITLLEGAYLGYRYTEQYHIEENDLDTLLEKVKTLHLYAEDVFLEWIERYKLLINIAQND